MTIAITEAQFKAAFLAARAFGKILDDEVLAAIITAADEAGAKERQQATEAGRCQATIRGGARCYRTATEAGLCGQHARMAARQSGGTR